MPKRAESVIRWVLTDNHGHYSIDFEQSQFSERLEDAFVFNEEPQRTVAVQAKEVTVSLVRGAD